MRILAESFRVQYPWLLHLSFLDKVGIPSDPRSTI